jgi:hypothetical protein
MLKTRSDPSGVARLIGARIRWCAATAAPCGDAQGRTGLRVSERSGVLIGLGDSAGPVRVRVTWPDGKNEEWADVPIDRWMTLKQGTGT